MDTILTNMIMLMLMAMAIRIDDGHKPQQQYGDQPNNDDVDNYNNDDEWYGDLVRMMMITMMVMKVMVSIEVASVKNLSEGSGARC